MMILPRPPKIPKNERLITFLEAFNDEDGALRSRYLWQQALKSQDCMRFWAFMGVTGMDMPMALATLKYESDKAHYLETGELPEDT